MHCSICCLFVCTKSFWNGFTFSILKTKALPSKFSGTDFSITVASVGFFEWISFTTASHLFLIASIFNTFIFCGLDVVPEEYSTVAFSATLSSWLFFLIALIFQEWFQYLWRQVVSIILLNLIQILNGVVDWFLP